MPLPSKALRYGQLKRKTAGSAVPTSGHEVVKVELPDGQTGFYKELIPDGIGDGSYPAILAQYSVAASILVRLALGERGAEDRLVFDKQGNITGSVSINLSDYKPLCSYGQTKPLDPQEFELVCPSTETLLKYNVAELLVSSWRIKCDDRHPGNFSLFGLIDWDMALYPYTYIMKGKRLIDGVLKDLPEKGMKLLSKHLDNFPNIEGRTHTPTNNMPGNGNILKRFSSYLEFQKLATNQALKTEAGDIFWQEQFFNALLKELLTFDPDMVRERLQEYFGEARKLDYYSLPQEKREQWEKEDPDLANGLQEYFGENLNLDYRQLSKEKSEQVEKKYPDLFKYLQEYFKGEVLLNYRVLPQAKREQLEKTYPDLFNEKTDKEPFVEHIMKVFQREYNELYSAVVFYAGCPQNNSQVPVVGFNRFLRNKPTSFQKVVEWATLQNQKMEVHWDQHNKAEEATTNEKMPENGEQDKTVNELADNVLDGYATPPKSRYNLEKMTQRYHQIWRDAHTPTIKAIINDGYTLIHQLANDLRKAPLPMAMKDKEEWDISAMTESFQLIGMPLLLTESETVDCDNTNDLKIGLEALQTFVWELHNCTKQYYSIDRKELGFKDNQDFCRTVANLITKSETEVLPHLLGSRWAEPFGNCLTNLRQFYSGLHFQCHLLSTKDVALSEKATQDYSVVLTRKHTDEEVVTTCLNTLFTWVNTLERETFNSMILNTLDGYKPSTYNVIANRSRAPEVEVYLKTATQDCANCLAKILSEGGAESTSLNTNLMRNLIPIMLEATQAQVEVNLLSVRNAVEYNTFQAEFYAKKAQEFVKKDTRFTIPVSDHAIAQFNDVMFAWAEKQDKKRIARFVRLALSDYQPYSWNIFSARKRTPIVEGFLKEFHKGKYSNEKLLALILADGSNEDSSLNTHLLKRILKAMKQDASNGKNSELDLASVCDITEDHLPCYGSKLKELAKPKTYQKQALSKAKTEASIADTFNC